MTGGNNTINRRALRQEFVVLPTYAPIPEDNYALDAPECIVAGSMSRFQAITIPDFEYILQTCFLREE